MKTFLFILVSFIAITSTLSGLLMISNSGGGILNLPLGLLDGTPFRFPDSGDIIDNDRGWCKPSCCIP